MTRFSGKADFKVTWRPYQLNAKAPGGAGVNKLAMYREKFGAERVAQMLPRMDAVGKQDGINFSYGGNVGNTFDSHRLISFAQKQGKQDELVEEIFRNYFEEEKCLSDHAVLLAAAQKVGLRGVEELLGGEAEVDAVKAELREFSSMAHSGVPQFVFNGRPYSQAGALEPAELEQIFDAILKGRL